MRIIDLLNKIANGEEVPKKIKYGVHYWTYNKTEKDYKDNDGDWAFSCSNYDIIEMLNDTVEILEEENKIEKLEHYDLFDYFSGYDYGKTDKVLLKDLETNFIHINEELAYLIDEINKLKENK